jgi:hypothetical protein
MKSPAVFSLLLVATAYAQTQNPLIPQGISTSCSTYMSTLDSDTQMQSCTKAFTNAVASFGPGSSSNSVSVSAVNSALNTLSSSLSACSPSDIRSQLTNFYSACSNELTSSPNSGVIQAYDVLYVLYPFSQAVCTKDDSGNYCVLEVGSSTNTSKTLLSSSSTDSSPAADLWSTLSSGNTRRGEDQVVTPNFQQFKSLNLVFLGLLPSTSADQLCKTCTRNVLNQYIAWMSSISYAPGVPNSPLMSGETDLYNAVQQKCGAPFLSGSVQAAGGISGGILNGGAADLSVNTRTVVGALFATVAGFFITL